MRCDFLPIAALAMLTAALAAPPLGASPGPSQVGSAPPVVFGFVSDPGDYLGGGRTKTFTSAGGSFLVVHEPGAVFIEYDGGLDEPWSLAFQAPRGSELTPGVYEGAANNVSPRKPAVSIIGEPRFCSLLIFDPGGL